MSLQNQPKPLTNILPFPTDSATFLEGPPGTGKTSLATEHLLYLLNTGINPQEILILLPQRSLGKPFTDILNRTDLPPGGGNSVLTLSGLAQRLISIFWPVILEEAGFKLADREPGFLTLESAQYYIAGIIDPLLDEGFFESIKIDKTRLYSQILDNLNKSAFVGFPHTGLAERLSSAWIGKPEQLRVFEEVQVCANRFRDFCFENNLLDFSLQIEIFQNFIWTSSICREYLFSTYHHLIYDNIEEDIPVSHDLIGEWLPYFDSALIVYDHSGGYRSFLGADPQNALKLKNECHKTIYLDKIINCPEGLFNFQNVLNNIILRKTPQKAPENIRDHVFHFHERYFPQLLKNVCAETKRLIVEENIPPAEISILSPFLSDSLRFTIQNELDNLGIPSKTSRPSRSLADEPASRCLLTFAKLAHPSWQVKIGEEDIRLALMQAVEGLDLVRADLLSRIILQTRNSNQGINSFYQIKPDMQERITYIFGDYYEMIRQWLNNYYESNIEIPLDHFLSKFFGEILSQPGFGFHNNLDSASLCARLIESIYKFRRVVSDDYQNNTSLINQKYISMLEEGILAAQYLPPKENEEDNAVFIAPAYTFLMSNRVSRCQFWLDISSFGWWERLNQPLTHPYVLSRHWPEGQKWTDADEYENNQLSLTKLITGLTLRTTDRIILCNSKIGEHGTEQKGPLLQSVQTLIRLINKEGRATNV